MKIKRVLAACAMLFAMSTGAQAVSIAFAEEIAGTVGECYVDFNSNALCANRPIGSPVRIFLNGTVEVDDPTQNLSISDQVVVPSGTGDEQPARSLMITTDLPLFPIILLEDSLVFDTGFFEVIINPFSLEYVAPTGPGALGSVSIQMNADYFRECCFFQSGPYVLRDDLRSSVPGLISHRVTSSVDLTSAPLTVSSVTFVAPPEPQPAPVPLPAGLWLALTGLGAMGLLRRRA